MIEKNKNGIRIMIDDVNASEIGTFSLRSNLSIIPSDSFIYGIVGKSYTNISYE